MMLDKSKCFDIFQKVEVEKMRMYENKSLQKVLKFKYKVSGLKIQMAKLKMILSIGGLWGVFYVRALLKKI